MPRLSRLPRFTCYLLLSEHGELYVGYTGHLRRRFRQHNDPENKGYTRGRRWHLLAVMHFPDRHTALRAERKMKQTRAKRRWLRNTPRVDRLCARHGIDRPKLIRGKGKRAMGEGDLVPAARRSSLARAWAAGPGSA